MYEVQFLRFGEDVSKPEIVQSQAIGQAGLEDAKARARFLFATSPPSGVNGYRLNASGRPIYQWREDY